MAINRPVLYRSIEDSAKNYLLALFADHNPQVEFATVPNPNPVLRYDHRADVTAFRCTYKDDSLKGLLPSSNTVNYDVPIDDLYKFLEIELNKLLKTKFHSDLISAELAQLLAPKDFQNNAGRDIIYYETSRFNAFVLHENNLTAIIASHTARFEQIFLSLGLTFQQTELPDVRKSGNAWQNDPVLLIKINDGKKLLENIRMDILATKPLSSPRLFCPK